MVMLEQGRLAVECLAFQPVHKQHDHATISTGKMTMPLFPQAE
jgi:hypothetical protein